MPEPRTPGLRDMAPPLFIAPAVAAAVFGARTLSGTAAAIAAVSALAATGLIGWPLIFWMVDNGRDGRIGRTLVGAIAGATPFLVALGSGILGLYIKSNDVSYVRWTLGYGANVPYFGMIVWSRFAALVALGMLCGTLTLWGSAFFQHSRRVSLE